jgi:hypothetical protein
VNQPFRPRRLVCPYCGNDGSVPDDRGRYPAFLWMENDLMIWEVVGVHGRAHDRGIVILENDGEHEDHPNPDPRIYCQACGKEFPPPEGCRHGVEWETDDDRWGDNSQFLTGPWWRCAEGCPGWLHVDDPYEIEKCDDCARFMYDEDAILAHRVECGCGHNEAWCRKCDHEMRADDKDPLKLVCTNPLCDAVFNLHVHAAYYKGLGLEGRRVRFAEHVDRYPHFAVEPGATGVVTAADRNYIEVLLEDHYVGAEEWQNRCHFYINDDGYAEEFLDAIKEWSDASTEDTEGEPGRGEAGTRAQEEEADRPPAPHCSARH